ncbi:MAG: DNA cytosine methyltransferase [Microgenomates group bacterium]
MGKKKWTFIDLFAGIGGFHIALHNLGADCVYVSEFEKYCRITYENYFKPRHPELFKNSLRFGGDITEVTKSREDINKHIPKFDILTGGFPCQPFSQAGHKKGFLDETRGTLFFNIAKILEEKKPKAFFVENVRGLLHHNEGKTLATMKTIIEELGYSFRYKVIKASDFGLPTHRPRLYIVGFKGDSDYHIPFKFPDPVQLKLTMSDILGGKAERTIGFTLRVGGKSSGIDDRRNWDTYRVDGKVVKITVDQAKTLMGFPKDFTFPVSNTQAMKQLGNSVAIPAIQATAAAVIDILNKYYV